MKPIILPSILFFSLTSCIQPESEQTSKTPLKEICITIDDLPVVNYGINTPGYLTEITRNLINTFSNYQIPAIGFVNERKLYKNGDLIDEQVQLLEMWLKNGYELGNHTFSHMNYHTNTFDDYTADILRGELVSKPLAMKYEQDYKYFRHPYLRIGQSKAAHDSLRNFLAAHSYEEAPVSIDNEDYLFALAYSRAFEQKDDSLMQKIGEDYVAYMEDKLLHFEDISHKLFNRNIKHILLLHANKLNAEYLDELGDVYQKHGYTFISMKAALEDEAYQSEISNYGNWGISWLDRWALSRGKKGGFFEGDPQTPTYIKQLAE